MPNKVAGLAGQLTAKDRGCGGSYLGSKMDVYKISGSLDYLSVEYESVLREFADANAGRVLPKSSGPFFLRSIKGSAKKGTPLGDCPYFGSGLLLVSSRLRSIMSESQGSDVDFCPVIIDGVHEYWYVHVVCALDALDLARSEFKTFPDGAIKYVAMARFREDVVNGRGIFKLTNYGGVYVTSEFKQHLELDGVKGIEFQDAAERVDNPFAKVLGRR